MTIIKRNFTREVEIQFDFIYCKAECVEHCSQNDRFRKCLLFKKLLDKSPRLDEYFRSSECIEYFGLGIGYGDDE